jgi:glycosyltransferase involved in cell wall biosynthesis
MLHQIGRVSEAELWALYRHATVFAFPSRHEGFGLPVLEAMSQGVPVVASDIPVLREVAGGAAVLVAPDQPQQWAEAIAGLLGDEAARSHLADTGRQRSRSYTVGAMVASTRHVYQTVGS